MLVFLDIDDIAIIIDSCGKLHIYVHIGLQ